MPNERSLPAYVTAHAEALATLAEIGELLNDQLAPEQADCQRAEIDWGDVATLDEVNRRLASVVNFLKGSEE